MEGVTMEEKIDQILEGQAEDRQVLARLDERTQQHEKRMDRSDNRAAGLGAVAGAIGGFFAGLLKGFTGSG